MIQKVEGIVRGKSIEIAEELGLQDGERVELTVERVARGTDPARRNVKRSAGISAEDEQEFDDIFEQLERERKSATYREP